MSSSSSSSFSLRNDNGSHQNTSTRIPTSTRTSTTTTAAATEHRNSKIHPNITSVEPQSARFPILPFGVNFHRLIQEQEDHDPYYEYFSDYDQEQEVAKRCDVWEDYEETNKIFEDPTVLGLLKEWQEQRLANSVEKTEREHQDQEDTQLRPTWSSEYGIVDEVSEYGDPSSLQLRPPRLTRPLNTTDDKLRRMLSSSVRGRKRIPFEAHRATVAQKRPRIESRRQRRSRKSRRLDEANDRNANNQINNGDDNEDDEDDDDDEDGDDDYDDNGEDISMTPASVSASTSVSPRPSNHLATSTSTSTPTPMSPSYPAQSRDHTRAVTIGGDPQQDGSYSRSSSMTPQDARPSSSSTPNDVQNSDCQQRSDSNGPGLKRRIISIKEMEMAIRKRHDKEDKELLRRMDQERIAEEDRIKRTSFEDMFQSISMLLDDSELKTLADEYRFQVPIPLRPPLNCVGPPPGHYSRPYKPIMDTETVVSVAIFSAVRPSQRAEEILFLGSQRLSALRDAFYCLSDFFTHPGDQPVVSNGTSSTSSPPPSPSSSSSSASVSASASASASASTSSTPSVPLAKNRLDRKTSNSFFFIEGVFYNDSPLLRAKIDKRDGLREQERKRLEDLAKQCRQRKLAVLRKRREIRRGKKRKIAIAATVGADATATVATTTAGTVAGTGAITAVASPSSTRGGQSKGKDKSRSLSTERDEELRRRSEVDGDYSMDGTSPAEVATTATAGEEEESGPGPVLEPELALEPEDVQVEFDDSDLREQMRNTNYRERPIEEIELENEEEYRKVSSDYS
ncbi:hypothetical protein BX616_001561, partial [Lobosporangium transversale]